MKSLRMSVCLLMFFSALVQAGYYEQARDAEARGEWSDALRLYRSTLSEDPANLSAWLRLSDVHARVGEWGAAGKALREAGTHHPNEAEVFYRGARAFAEANDPEAGLEMARRAVELGPDNPDYLETQGSLAGWLGLGPLAIESFERALEASPDRTRLLLPLGLQKAWAGQLDEGASLVRRFLQAHPGRDDAMLHLVDFEIWRGNYAGAMRVLEDYRAVAGENRAYLGKRARILAWARQRDAAMRILDRLLVDEPDSLDLHYSRTLALRETQPALALESLAVVERLSPETSDTIDLGRSTRLPQRSRIIVGLDGFRDSDSIRTRALTVGAAHHFDLDTRAEVSVQRRRWEADIGSGLDPGDGRSSIHTTRYRVGVEHRLNPDVSVRLHAGQNDIERVGTSWLYGIGASWRLSDQLSLGLAHDRDLMAISPRTVFNHLERRQTAVTVDWDPGIAHHVNVLASYQDISDGNARRSLSSVYRYDWIRSANWNVDASVAGGWVSFRDNPNTGYYAPSRYRFVGVGMTAYWKISDDDGIGVNYQTGFQRDETFDRARTYYDVSVHAVFGIFRDWMLRVSAGYSNRQNDAGGFDAKVVELRVERRF